jgi:hypothetical protein
MRRRGARGRRSTCATSRPAGVAAGALVLQPALYDLERQEVLALLTEHPLQALDVVVVEFPVTRRCALRINESLAFEKPDLGDGDVRKLLAQQRQHIAY